MIVIKISNMNIYIVKKRLVTILVDNVNKDLQITGIVPINNEITALTESIKVTNIDFVKRENIFYQIFNVSRNVFCK